MQVFGEGQPGCFYAMSLDAAPSRGAVLQINTADGPRSLPSADPTSSPFVITGFDMGMNESVMFQKTFNDRIYTYAFGATPGTLTVHLTAFLGTSKETVKSAFDEIGIAYKTGRVSVSAKQASLSFGGNSVLRGVIVGVAGSTSNVETGIHAFSITMRIIHIGRKHTSATRTRESAAAATDATRETTGSSATPRTATTQKSNVPDPRTINGSYELYNHYRSRSADVNPGDSGYADWEAANYKTGTRRGTPLSVRSGTSYKNTLGKSSQNLQKTLNSSPTRKGVPLPITRREFRTGPSRTYRPLPITRRERRVQ